MRQRERGNFAGSTSAVEITSNRRTSLPVQTHSRDSATFKSGDDKVNGEFIFEQISYAVLLYKIVSRSIEQHLSHNLIFLRNH